MKEWPVLFRNCQPPQTQQPENCYTVYDISGSQGTLCSVRLVSADNFVSCRRCTIDSWSVARGHKCNSFSHIHLSSKKLLRRSDREEKVVLHIVQHTGLEQSMDQAIHGPVKVVCMSNQLLNCPFSLFYPKINKFLKFLITFIHFSGC
jgi:hypothetical protein